MILLLGGTSETAPLALALAKAGFPVLVSTATDEPLDVGEHPNISRRTGAMDRLDMAKLVEELSVRVIVDASHPYASAARANAKSVAAQLHIPYRTWVRPAAFENDRACGSPGSVPEVDTAPQSGLAQTESEGELPLSQGKGQGDGSASEHQPLSIHFVDDHQAAASLACSFKRPVLLTTGSRNVVPYAAEAAREGIRLVVRVLPRAESVEACKRSGVRAENIVTGRGPFSLEQNIDLIRRFRIGVLVTKDSGRAGGVRQKLEAARRQGCRVVVVRRPQEVRDVTFADFGELIQAVSESWAG